MSPDINIISESALQARWGCSKATVYRKTKLVAGAVIANGQRMIPLSEVLLIESTSPVRPYKKKVEEVKRRKYRKRRKPLQHVYSCPVPAPIEVKPAAPSFITRLIMLIEPTYGGYFVKG